MLLETPAYAALWTTRLCDYTGNNESSLVNIGPVRGRESQDWYDWIYRRVEENTRELAPWSPRSGADPKTCLLSFPFPIAIKDAGFLGVKYASLNTGSTPRPGQSFSVRGIALRNGLTISEVNKRQQLLQKLDKTFQAIESLFS